MASRWVAEVRGRWVVGSTVFVTGPGSGGVTAVPEGRFEVGFRPEYGYRSCGRGG